MQKQKLFLTILMADNIQKIRVLLGMSGGVDSSVSALMLKNKGYQVIGATFLFSDVQLKNECIIDVNKLAQKLEIQHYTIDLRNEFKNKIIDNFINSYENGKTPFPCAICNPEIKFYHLNKLANELNCDFISTGHYVGVSNINGVKYISEGKDKEKDQSFFLWGLNQKIVNKLIFPLGAYNKSEIREFARQQNLSLLSEKKDSMGICFIESSDYRNFLKNNGVETKEGNFIDMQGNAIGRHNGIINYTIGQRRGLGLNLNKPVFVSEIKASENEIVLSDYNDLYKCIIIIDNIHFINFQSVSTSKTYNVKIRYRLQKNMCRIRFLENERAEINLLEPVSMVAPGQTAVIYENERVIGGGFIVDSAPCQ